MKKITLICLTFIFSSVLNANVRPWPNLTVFPMNADLWLNNYEDKSYNCSGNVFLYFRSGKVETHYYYRFLGPRATDYRSFRNFNYNDSIISANHTISCF